jgi:PAS domain S-box-containing protein
MRFWFKSFVVRFVLSFLVLATAIVCLVAFVAFSQAREALNRSAVERLDAIATLKANNIRVWVNDQVRDTLFLAQLPAFRKQAVVLSHLNPSDVRYERVARSLTNDLKDLLANRPSVQDVLVLSLNGDVIISTNESLIGTSYANETLFFQGHNLLFPSSSFVQNVYISKETARPLMSVVVPLFDVNGERFGLLVAHLYLERLNRIVMDRTGLGVSGETYLVDHEYRFVSESRYRQQLFDSPTGVHTEGIDQVVGQRQDGSGSYINYDGVQVFGVYQWLGEREMALLAEIHQDEVFAPVRKLVLTIVWVGMVAVGMVAIGVYALARHVSRRILVLTRGAARIAEGDLSGVAPVVSQDEVGMLARVLHQIIGHMRRLYEKVEKNERLYRTLFDVSYDAIVLVSADGTFLDVNPSGARLLGYTQNELQAIPRDRLFVDPKAFDTLSTTLQDSGFVHDVAVRLLRRDGAILHCLVTAMVHTCDDSTMVVIHVAARG